MAALAVHPLRPAQPSTILGALRSKIEPPTVLEEFTKTFSLDDLLCVNEVVPGIDATTRIFRFDSSSRCMQNLIFLLLKLEEVGKKTEKYPSLNVLLANDVNWQTNIITLQHLIAFLLHQGKISKVLALGDQIHFYTEVRTFPSLVKKEQCRQMNEWVKGFCPETVQIACKASKVLMQNIADKRKNLQRHGHEKDLKIVDFAFAHGYSQVYPEDLFPFVFHFGNSIEDEVAYYAENPQGDEDFNAHFLEIDRVGWDNYYAWRGGPVTRESIETCAAKRKQYLIEALQQHKQRKLQKFATYFVPDPKLVTRTPAIGPRGIWDGKTWSYGFSHTEREIAALLTNSPLQTFMTWLLPKTDPKPPSHHSYQKMFDDEFMPLDIRSDLMLMLLMNNPSRHIHAGCLHKQDNTFILEGRVGQDRQHDARAVDIPSLNQAIKEFYQQLA